MGTKTSDKEHSVTNNRFVTRPPAGNVTETLDEDDPMKLLGSLDISNLNISFNANSTAAASNDQENIERELLVKSFAKVNSKNYHFQDRRARSAVPRKSVATRRSRPVSARAKTRQDSSSSNPDNHNDTQHPARGNTVAANHKKMPMPKSQMPETPLHSSETPRSSSLYQPETEEDDRDHDHDHKGKEETEISEDEQNGPDDEDSEEIIESLG